MNNRMNEKWIFAVCAIAVLLAVSMLAGCSRKKVDDEAERPKIELKITVNGERLEIGQHCGMWEFEETYGMSIFLEPYHQYINPTPDTYMAINEDSSIEIRFGNPENGGYDVEWVEISGAEADADVNGLKIGDPAEMVCEVFPEAVFAEAGYGLGYYYVFFLDHEGNCLSTVDMHKLYDEASERGQDAIGELAKSYIYVCIDAGHAGDKIVGFDVGYLTAE